MPRKRGRRTVPIKSPHLLVTAGPTREMLDPVRFLSNVSTGHMGYEVARVGKEMGFRVTLVSGPTVLAPPRGVRFVPVLSAEEMKRAVFGLWPKTDALVMTAAVCDYAPVRYSPRKIKRIKQRIIQFKRTTDILEAVGKRKGDRVVVGFALETEAVEQNAIRKLKRKNLDLIVVNWYGPTNNPFGNRRVSIILIGRGGFRKSFKHLTKRKAASIILQRVVRSLISKKG